VDGQALVLARGPAAAIAAIRASLKATLPLEADPADERSRGAREFDLFVDLLTGGAQAGSWLAEVLVPFSVAAGGELELAEIPGLGPILPSTARDLLDQADTIGQTALDPDGQVIAVSDPIRMPAPVPAHAPTPADITADISHDAPTDRPTDDPTDLPTDRPAEDPASPAMDLRLGPLDRPLPPDPVTAARLALLAAQPAVRELTYSGYRIPPRLRRFLEARDRTCVFPGCNRRARRTDKDHRRPWPLGPTSPDNVDCLCRHHHRAKHAVFTVLRDTDGSYLWISRGGWQFLRQPKGF
jgi:hypothetical protein